MTETVAAEIRRVNPERLSPTEVSNLLGIPYDLVLKYAHELTGKGLIEIAREAGKLFFSPAQLEFLRKYHEERPRASGFRVEGDPDLHKRLLKSLDTLASKLDAMASLARARIKELNKAPASSTSWISTLPAVGVTLRKPIPISVISDGKAFSAFSADTGSTATGTNRVEAVRALRWRLANEYVYLDQLASPSEGETERLAELKRFIRAGQD
jgi:hypothetical protein